MSSSDEDAIRRPGRNANAGAQSPAPSDANDANDDNKDLFGDDQMDGDNDADLFGSEGGSDAGLDDKYVCYPSLQCSQQERAQQDAKKYPSRARRTLDDERLDSGDDEGRYDRYGEDMDMGEDEEVRRTLNLMDVTLARAPVPETTDGQIYTMRVPEFLNIEAEEFNPETYVAPPFSTAATSLCWRQDPNDESKLQSNARFIQWEDGSVTLQLASAPLEQYRTSIKPLAPLDNSDDYVSKLDSHVYLGSAMETAEVFQLTSHVTHGLTILPTTNETDDAVQKLQESLFAAARGSKKTADGTVPIFETMEDPMAAARKAEIAQREELRAERRRQQMADREADRGRRGPTSRSMGTGLNVGSLEDGLSTRPRAKPRRQNRRGEIYSDEEEYGRNHRTREDDYDEDDGFLVGSDEEIEEEGDDEDEEDVLEDDEEDAEGEVDDEVAPSKSARSKPSEPERTGTPQQRKKNRYVVDDDDDE
ncbi:hypothetical protein N7532_000231 [Penicillium argentinense]|uniref:RNA polymerase-associated protein LEO1 n=1 Tax=Penicillium argentinense TaxID=1131581 RepID=A0A9W9KNN0_9EURO|nr:uncharacterized protein N7532_000231 [Penicillium argentinense]KAJ5112186.1 hypothetical protein N7532_000231 [Penicillium argentinense]